MTDSGRRINLPEGWLNGLTAWAQKIDSISELWLFGSRAKDTARADSDLDVAVALMPPVGDHDWAFGYYVAVGQHAWRQEIEQIVGRKISFGAMTPGDEMDREVRSTGLLLWKRYTN